MAMVVLDASCLKQAEVSWLGLRVGGHLALFYIYQMNRVNSRNDLVVIYRPVYNYNNYYY